MADRVEERATALMTRDRKVNTRRRADMASRIEARATAEIAFAKTLRNIAEALNLGNARFLDGVRTMTGLEALLRQLRIAKEKWVEAQLEIRKKEDPTLSLYALNDIRQKINLLDANAEMMDQARFPEYRCFRSDVLRFGRRLAALPGAKQVGNRLLRAAESKDEYYAEVAKSPLKFSLQLTNGMPAGFKLRRDAEATLKRSQVDSDFVDLVELPKGFGPDKLKYWVVFSGSRAQERGLWVDPDSPILLHPDDVDEVIDKANHYNRTAAFAQSIEIPFRLESVQTDRKRLKAIGIDHGSLLRAALRELCNLREMPAKPDRVRQLERAIIGQSQLGIDFFPTPCEFAGA